MAALRRNGKLLVLSMIAIAGIISFWTRQQFSITANVDLGHISQGHVKRKSQANLTVTDQEALQKRLEFLEDVVYKKMHGLSKSLGLAEGFGGKGEGGLPTTMSPEKHVIAEEQLRKYGYNAYVSDQISLDRSIPDFRPKTCKEATYPRDLPTISLIFIFVNEALSVILRSIHSAVNHTPAHLLKEIVLVDDYSDDEKLKGPLEEYVNKRFPGLVKIVRNHKREGLIRARIEGWKVATGDVTGFFDAHVEFTPWWSEPALARIKEDRRRIILPSIDNIKYDTFALESYGNCAHGYNWELWCMYIHPSREWYDARDDSAPIRSPAMIGCSFVVHREYFEEIGLLDDGMDVYGGENIELGIRVWLCGGSMEALPCSRVAHLARTKKPYSSDIINPARRNSLRVAEVWMDEYKSTVYLAWNLPMENHGINYGDISQRLALKKRLQCKSFEWYLDNIYPRLRRYNDTIYYGKITQVHNSKVRHLCMDQGPLEHHTAILHPCHGWDAQLGRYTREGLLYLGALSSIGPETRCVVDDQVNNLPQLLHCAKISNQKMKTWHFSQNNAFINQATGRCLEVVPWQGDFGFQLVLQSCTNQRWTMQNSMTLQ